MVIVLGLQINTKNTRNHSLLSHFYTLTTKLKIEIFNIDIFEQLVTRRLVANINIQY